MSLANMFLTYLSRMCWRRILLVLRWERGLP